MAFKKEQNSYGYTSGLDSAYATDAIEAGSYSKVSMQTYVQTTDADGYLYIEGANQPDWGWSIIPFVDSDGAIQDGYHIQGADHNHMFDVSESAVGWVRLRWAPTSGGGELSWMVHRKK